VGAHARIAHFGGGHEPAVVVAVLEDGRRLQVRGEDGAVFVSAASSHGPRLELLGES
jgi:hypothetical protein